MEPFASSTSVRSSPHVVLNGPLHVIGIRMANPEYCGEIQLQYMRSLEA